MATDDFAWSEGGAPCCGCRVPQGRREVSRAGRQRCTLAGHASVAAVVLAAGSTCWDEEGQSRSAVTAKHRC